MYITLKRNEKVYISDILVQDSILTSEDLQRKLINMYHKAVSVYGDEPFKIEYGTTKGFFLRATCYVGVLIYDDIILSIESNIEGLDLGKVLYLQASIEGYTKESEDIINLPISNELSLESVDYYIIPFINKVKEILKVGLISILKCKSIESKKLKGRLEIKKQLSKNPSYDKFHIKRYLKTDDNAVNQLLKKALETAIKKTKLDSLKVEVFRLLENFSDVATVDILADEHLLDISKYTTLKRTDYEEAIIIAKYIIFGFDPRKGNEYKYFPEYLVNMDKMFEDYVVFSLKKMYISNFYSKHRLDLGVSPEISVNSKWIELDAFYEKDQTTRIVIDAKNKYKHVTENAISKGVMPSNADLFQQYYYAKRTNSKYIVLIYPTNKNYSSPLSEFEVNFDEEKVKFLCWALNISGEPKENYSSLKKLVNYLEKVK